MLSLSFNTIRRGLSNSCSPRFLILTDPAYTIDSVIIWLERDPIRIWNYFNNTAYSRQGQP
jgi:hypothetical protein